MVPVAPLGETVAVSVMDVPYTAELDDAVSVVVVLPDVLADELVPPFPHPATPSRITSAAVIQESA
jgi:hypothetical protein